MYKNITVPVISIEKLTISNLLSVFSMGIEIIFVLKSRRLFGGITQGDFNRGLKNGIKDITVEIVNTKIRYITLHDKVNAKEEAEQEAAEIFNQYNRINNIPVIDEQGIICFQYERERKVLYKRIINTLNIINRDMVFRAFFQCCDGLDIVITGADDLCMERARSLFVNRLSQYATNYKASTISIKSLMECSMLDERNIIITLNNFCKTYLVNYTDCRAKIISLDTLPEYEYYLRSYDLTKDGLLAWKNVFGYDGAIIIEKNQYIDYIKSLMEQCGLNVKSEYDSEKNLFGSKISTHSFLMSSGNGKYFEEVSVRRFVEIVELLQDYKNVSGESYMPEAYIDAFLRIISLMEKQGAEIIYFEKLNLIDERVWTACCKKKLKVINSNDKWKEHGKICVKDCRISKFGEKIATFDFASESIQYSINTEIYKKLKVFCNKVYCMNNRNINEISFTTYQGATRMNYIRKEKYIFPESFLEDMYGDKDYPIEALLEDISGCSIDKINEGYMKYRSNYLTEHFNTDTYGNRITTDTPPDSKNNIYLMGCCMMSGYAVSDYDTTASYLQRQINRNNLSYRVVNLGIDNGSNQYIYQKVLDREIKYNDIIVMQFSWADSEDDYTFSFDYMDMYKKLAGQKKRFYWDVINHCSSKGYELIANCIFTHIKKDLKVVKEFLFQVDARVGNEIETYLSAVKGKIDMCGFHKANVKSGAIVMNCNPFTYGHQYLIETAARLVEILYIFVVEEDKSVFSFEERYRMVCEGTKGFRNVFVLSGGRFMISSMTFPGYFMKEEPTNECYDSFLDLKIFAHYIAPAFNISMRFVGEEPFDRVTAQYNCDMRVIFERTGISVIEIPRRRLDGEVISATVVRQLLEEGNCEAIKGLVPESTYNILFNKEAVY